MCNLRSYGGKTTKAKRISQAPRYREDRLVGAEGRSGGKVEREVGERSQNVQTIIDYKIIRIMGYNVTSWDENDLYYSLTSFMKFLK